LAERLFFVDACDDNDDDDEYEYYHKNTGVKSGAEDIFYRLTTAEAGEYYHEIECESQVFYNVCHSGTFYLSNESVYYFLQE
jgi:hypothetical protein